MKPLLLLDVDGVLCPFVGHLRLEAMLGHDVDFPGFQYSEWAKVFWCQEIADRVKMLMKSFEIHWCTGWQNTANEIISPLHGLPEFPVVPIRYLDLEGKHWKEAAIADYMNTHYPTRPYAFVDDEIVPGLEYGEDHDAPVLWLSTKCDEGLTDEHVDQLEKFAQDLASEYSAC